MLLLMSGVKWDIREIMSQHNVYVDVLLQVMLHKKCVVDFWCGIWCSIKRTRAKSFIYLFSLSLGGIGISVYVAWSCFKRVMANMSGKYWLIYTFGRHGVTNQCTFNIHSLFSSYFGPSNSMRKISESFNKETSSILDHHSYSYIHIIIPLSLVADSVWHVAHSQLNGDEWAGKLLFGKTNQGADEPLKHERESVHTYLIICYYNWPVSH